MYSQPPETAARFCQFGIFCHKLYATIVGAAHMQRAALLAVEGRKRMVTTALEASAVYEMPNIRARQEPNGGRSDAVRARVPPVPGSGR
jgi:hypothetical protein